MRVEACLLHEQIAEGLALGCEAPLLRCNIVGGGHTGALLIGEYLVL